MGYMYTYMKDNLRREEKVLEILENMMSAVERLKEATDTEKSTAKEKLIVKRLIKKLRSSLAV